MDRARLVTVPMFAGLPDGDLDVIAAAASEGEAEMGQTLITEGDFGYALYAVESGSAEVSTHGVVVGTLGPGDVFGEMAVIASGRRTATVVATAPMRLITLFNRDVWALERRAPDVATRLRELIAARLATYPQRAE